MKHDRLIKIEIPPALRLKMLETAQHFRKQPTRSEAQLWQALRGKKLGGIKFRRQQPIGPFVVDFYAPAYRLVVEVDGPVHDRQVDADQARQQLLESIGLCVLRIPAALVENDLPKALQTIFAACKLKDA